MRSLFWGSIVVVFLILSLATAQAQQADAVNPKTYQNGTKLNTYSQRPSNIRLLRLSVGKNNSITVGGMPLFLATYDATGGTGGTGGGVRLSGNYANTIIDMEEIPRSFDPFSPTIGVQINGGMPSIAASIRRRNVEHLFLDENGLGFPETRRSVAKDGPFINITFLNSAHHVIDLSTIDIKVLNTTGKMNITPQDYEIVLVKAVQREPLRVHISDRRSGQTWSTDLFPMYRSSEPNLILYTIRDIAIGEPLAGNPSYEGKASVQITSKEAKDAQHKCDAGDFEACNSLGVLFSKGDGVAQNSAEAARLFSKACEGGQGLACSNLGALYAIGEGVEKDFVRAREILAKGCNLNNGTSCYNLGAIYANGLGIKKDDTEKQRFMKKACDLGVKQACSYK
jgi:hypothetical protein